MLHSIAQENRSLLALTCARVCARATQRSHDQCACSCHVGFHGYWPTYSSKWELLNF